MAEPPLRLRVGRTLGRTLYLDAGTGNPLDDECIALLPTRELAEQIVMTVNAANAVRAQVYAEIRQLADQNGSVCTSDEGTSYPVSALIPGGPCATT